MLETKNDIKQTSDNKITEPLYMCLQRRAEQEGLYFPRRFCVDDLSKARLFNRIENQNFKGASEEEIFRLMIINLNEIEINKCWEEMATQIKTFKRKYRKLEVKLQQKNISFQMDPLSVYESTQKVIAKSCQSSDPRDHKDLLKNLSTVIVEGRLSTASDDFNIICKQVRGCMPMHLLSSFYKQTSKGFEDVIISDETTVYSPVCNDYDYKFVSDPLNIACHKSLNDICNSLNHNFS